MKYIRSGTQVGVVVRTGVSINIHNIKLKYHENDAVIITTDKDWFIRKEEELGIEKANTINLYRFTMDTVPEILLVMCGEPEVYEIS